MKCKKCGSNDWYVRGNYKRCRPCHNRTQAVLYHNKKLGIVTQRKQSHKARPLSEEMKILPELFLQRKFQTTCKRNHELSKDNVRLDIDKKGRTHRRCLKCEYLTSRRRYSKEPVSQISKLMQEGNRPWETLGEV